MNPIINEKKIHQGQLVISHQFDPCNQIDMAETSHHLLCYLLDGIHTRKVTQIGDQEYTGNIRKGDICIKPTSHSGFWAWEEPDDSLVFLIHPHFLHQIAVENDFINPDKVELQPVLNQHDPQLDQLMSLFHQEIDGNQVGSLMYLESLSNMLAVHLLRHHCVFPIREPQYEGGLPTYKLNQVIDYINFHLEEDISLGELANVVKLSQSHFSALFRESTGQSPYKFLIQQRLARAQELLLETDRAISDIATSVGFCDQSHLSRHMKKLLGVSPKQIRDFS